VLNQREVETIKAAISLSEMIKQTIYLDEFINKTKESRLQQIQKLIADTSCSHLVINRIFRVGLPYEELIRTINEENIDLVGMGSKGRSNLPGVLLGSTARKMFRYCSVPLLTIRPNH
jgi:nucleotide-binding universal stress UspA family protein